MFLFVISHSIVLLFHRHTKRALPDFTRFFRKIQPDVKARVEIFRKMKLDLVIIVVNACSFAG
ncbi:hypothetical protein D0T66_13770 [Dysgonomonas sp. 25]|nr:hypothetical protein [Dysgonomonas sp. 25]